MLPFFRKIRYRLAKDNQFLKYSRYAIGEIVLVVIGILIALQINNWNEEKKNKAFEKEILEQLSANLIKDKMTLQMVTANFDHAVNSTQKILRSNWSPMEQDSLQYWLGDVIQFDRFQPLTNAYEVAKSKGLDLISNKQLRFLLGTYYDDASKHAVKSIEDIERVFSGHWVPFMQKEGLDFKFREYVVVRDYTIFKEDTDAKGVLRLNQDNYRSGSETIKIVIGIIEKLQALIKEELDAME